MQKNSVNGDIKLLFWQMNGYCLKWRLYSSKEPELNRQEDVSKTQQTVTDLVSDFKE